MSRCHDGSVILTAEWAFLFFRGGIGLVMYVLMWILVPEEAT